MTGALKALGVVVLVGCAAAGGAGAQEAAESPLTFGVESTSILEYQLVDPIVPAGSSAITPRLMARSGGAEAAAAASATVDSLQGVSLSCDELWGRVFVGDVAVLTVGWFTYRPGTALLFSNVQYFSSLDPARILTQGLDAKGSPDDMFQVKLLGDSWHLTVTGALFRPGEDLFPTDSPWFPRRDIRESFDVLSTTYTLRTLAWDTTSQPALVVDPGLSVDAGIFAGPVDVSLSWFDGPDRDPAVTALITMPVNPWGVYDITLQQAHGNIQREGAAGSLQLGAWKAWIDTSLFQGKLFATGDLYSAAGGWKTGVRPLDGWDLTCGLSWNPPLAGSTVALEWKDSFSFGDVTGLSFPLLHRAIAALVTGTFFDDKVRLSLAGVLSLSDNSVAVLPGASIDVGSSGTLSIACPYFFGGPATELGQFARAGRGMVSMKIGF
jgi:hypothetical protein